MKKFLVIGNPIEHSLSPKLQNYWIQINNLKAIYGKLETNLNDLAETKTRNTYCTVSKFPQKYTAEKQPRNAQTLIPERIRSR